MAERGVPGERRDGRDALDQLIEGDERSQGDDDSDDQQDRLAAGDVHEIILVAGRLGAAGAAASTRVSGSDMMFTDS